MTNQLVKLQEQVASQAMKCCLNYIIPVFFADPPDKKGGRVYKNGTCLLIDTGNKKFAITNHHVIEGFRQKKKN